MSLLGSRGPKGPKKGEKSMESILDKFQDSLKDTVAKKGYLKRQPRSSPMYSPSESRRRGRLSDNLSGSMPKPHESPSKSPSFNFGKRSSHEKVPDVSSLFGFKPVTTPEEKEKDAKNTAPKRDHTSAIRSMLQSHASFDFQDDAIDGENDEKDHGVECKTFDSEYGGFFGVDNPMDRTMESALEGLADGFDFVPEETEEDYFEYPLMPPKPSAIVIPEYLSLRKLSQMMRTPVDDVNKIITDTLGMTQKEPSEILDSETIDLIGLELDITVMRGSDVSKSDRLPTVVPIDRDHLPPRPPIACILGHVNHGKTSLLDALRKTNVVDSEAGAITQSIGGFLFPNKTQDICFLDTPGHSVFRAMRSRGCRVTDVVVLLVSATDGVQEQTIEAISFVQEAGLPTVVAISKCDVDGVDVDAVKADLLNNGIVVEDLGGDIMSVEISSKTGQGLDELVEAIAVMREAEDLRACPSSPGEFAIFNTNYCPKQGHFLDAVVRWGTLRVGDVFVSGRGFGRVRRMLDCKGREIQSAGPASPVSIFGLRGEEKLGEDGLVVTDEQEARSVISFREDTSAYSTIWDAKLVEQEEAAKKAAAAPVYDKGNQMSRKWRRRRRRARLGDVGEGSIDPADENEELVSELSVVLRADTQGSLEAFSDYFALLPSEPVSVNLVKTAVGPPTESDVVAAELLPNAAILNFNVKVPNSIVKDAEKKEIPIKSEQVIYPLFDHVVNLASQLMPDDEKIEITGSAVVLKPIQLNDKGRRTITAGGLRVRKGVMAKNTRWRIVRDENVLFTAESATSLRHFKDTVDTVGKGDECGVILKGFDEYQEGDVVQCYTVNYIKQRFDDERARRLVQKASYEDYSGYSYEEYQQS